MQFFVTNPRKGHTKIIRNIPITTDKLIHEIVINSNIFNLSDTDVVMCIILVIKKGPMTITIILILDSIQDHSTGII